MGNCASQETFGDCFQDKVRLRDVRLLNVVTGEALSSNLQEEKFNFLPKAIQEQQQQQLDQDRKTSTTDAFKTAPNVLNSELFHLYIDPVNENSVVIRSEFEKNLYLYSDGLEGRGPAKRGRSKVRDTNTINKDCKFNRERNKSNTTIKTADTCKSKLEIHGRDIKGPNLELNISNSDNASGTTAASSTGFKEQRQGDNSENILDDPLLARSIDQISHSSGELVVEPNPVENPENSRSRSRSRRRSRRISQNNSNNKKLSNISSKFRRLKRNVLKNIGMENPGGRRGKKRLWSPVGLEGRHREENRKEWRLVFADVVGPFYGDSASEKPNNHGSNTTSNATANKHNHNSYHSSKTTQGNSQNHPPSHPNYQNPTYSRGGVPIGSGVQHGHGSQPQYSSTTVNANDPRFKSGGYYGTSGSSQHKSYYGSSSSQTHSAAASSNETQYYGNNLQYNRLQYHQNTTGVYNTHNHANVTSNSYSRGNSHGHHHHPSYGTTSSHSNSPDRVRKSPQRDSRHYSGHSQGQSRHEITQGSNRTSSSRSANYSLSGLHSSSSTAVITSPQRVNPSNVANIGRLNQVSAGGGGTLLQREAEHFQERNESSSAASSSAESMDGAIGVPVPQAVSGTRAEVIGKPVLNSSNILGTEGQHRASPSGNSSKASRASSKENMERVVGSKKNSKVSNTGGNTQDERKQSITSIPISLITGLSDESANIHSLISAESVNSAVPATNLPSKDYLSAVDGDQLSKQSIVNSNGGKTGAVSLPKIPSGVQQDFKSQNRGDRSKSIKTSKTSNNTESVESESTSEEESNKGISNSITRVDIGYNPSKLSKDSKGNNQMPPMVSSVTVIQKKDSKTKSPIGNLNDLVNSDENCNSPENIENYPRSVHQERPLTLAGAHIRGNEANVINDSSGNEKSNGTNSKSSSLLGKATNTFSKFLNFNKSSTTTEAAPVPSPQQPDENTNRSLNSKSQTSKTMTTHSKLLDRSGTNLKDLNLLNLENISASATTCENSVNNTQGENTCENSSAAADSGADESAPVSIRGTDRDINPNNSRTYELPHEVPYPQEQQLKSGTTAKYNNNINREYSGSSTDIDNLDFNTGHNTSNNSTNNSRSNSMVDCYAPGAITCGNNVVPAGLFTNSVINSGGISAGLFQSSSTPPPKLNNGNALTINTKLNINTNDLSIGHASNSTSSGGGSLPFLTMRRGSPLNNDNVNGIDIGNAKQDQLCTDMMKPQVKGPGITQLTNYKNIDEITPHGGGDRTGSVISRKQINLAGGVTPAGEGTITSGAHYVSPSASETYTGSTSNSSSSSNSSYTTSREEEEAQSQFQTVDISTDAGYYGNQGIGTSRRKSGYGENNGYAPPVRLDHILKNRNIAGINQVGPSAYHSNSSSFVKRLMMKQNNGNAPSQNHGAQIAPSNSNNSLSALKDSRQLVAPNSSHANGIGSKQHLLQNPSSLKFHPGGHGSNVSSFRGSPGSVNNLQGADGGSSSSCNSGGRAPRAGSQGSDNGNVTALYYRDKSETNSDGIFPAQESDFNAGTRGRRRSRSKTSRKQPPVKLVKRRKNPQLIDHADWLNFSELHTERDLYFAFTLHYLLQHLSEREIAEAELRLKQAEEASKDGDNEIYENNNNKSSNKNKNSTNLSSSNLSHHDLLQLQGPRVYLQSRDSCPYNFGKYFGVSPQGGYTWHPKPCLECQWILDFVV